MSRYDAGFLTGVADPRQPWRVALRTLTQDERARLEAHLANLFASRVVTSPFAYNAPLVDAVRARLAHESPAQRANHQLSREPLRTMRNEPVTVAGAGGPQAALVLTRRSGKPLTDGIPSLYTYHGYWDGFDARRRGGSPLAKRRPVGARHPPTPATDNARLALEIRRTFLNDYIQAWDAYLNDLSIVDSQSLAQSMQIARTLSAPDSPLKQFLQAAADETTLLRARGGSERPAPGALQKRIGEAKESLSAMFGHASPDVSPPVADDQPEGIVDSHFEPLRRLVTASGASAAGVTPLEGNLRVLDELYSYLTAADAALASGSPPPQTDVFNKLQANAGRLPAPLRKIIGDLSQTSAVQVSGGARRNVAQDAQGSLGPLCRQAIAGRYPFARGSNRDVAWPISRGCSRQAG